VLDGMTGGRARNWRYQQSGTYAGAAPGSATPSPHSGERVSFGAQSGAQANYYDRGGDSHTAAYYSGVARQTRA
jgi:hypothetical protein